jgi:serine/threonine protein kinase
MCPTEQHAPERYTLQRRIAVGGTAEIYLARDGHLGRDVAVKLAAKEFSAKYANYRTLFDREGDLLAGLGHPHVLPIYDRYESERGPVLVLRYVPQTLHERIPVVAGAPSGAELDLLRQLAEALDFCHAEGWAHRDLKPSNVLVEHGSFAFLADFGIAARFDDVEKWREPAGTPEYISPEALLDTNFAAADPDRLRLSDQFSLGVLAYHLLTGNLPLEPAAPGRYRESVATCTAYRMMRGEEPVPCTERNPALPVRVHSVLQRLMHRQPSERFASCGIGVQALTEAARGGAPDGLRLFISYSRADERFADDLVARLRALDHEVWWDRSLQPGRSWDDQIEEAMERADVMLVLMSPDSTRSDEVKHEWRYWVNYLRRPLVPVMVRLCRPPYRLAAYQHLDAAASLEGLVAQLDRLLRIELRAQVEAARRAATDAAGGATARTPMDAPSPVTRGRDPGRRSSIAFSWPDIAPQRPAAPALASPAAVPRTLVPHSRIIPRDDMSRPVWADVAPGLETLKGDVSGPLAAESDSQFRRCEAGHLYDAALTPRCPWCGVPPFDRGSNGG